MTGPVNRVVNVRSEPYKAITPRRALHADNGNHRGITIRDASTQFTAISNPCSQNQRFLKFSGGGRWDIGANETIISSAQACGDLDKHRLFWTTGYFPRPYQENDKTIVFEGASCAKIACDNPGRNISEFTSYQDVWIDGRCCVSTPPIVRTQGINYILANNIAQSTYFSVGQNAYDGLANTFETQANNCPGGYEVRDVPRPNNLFTNQNYCDLGKTNQTIARSIQENSYPLPSTATAAAAASSSGLLATLASFATPVATTAIAAAAPVATVSSGAVVAGALGAGAAVAGAGVAAYALSDWLTK